MSFAVRAVQFVRTLPRTWEARRIGGQLIDSATSMAINYRAAGRARSTRDFVHKIGVVVEEADESVGWLEMIGRLGLSVGPEYSSLHGEAAELLAIFGASQLTAKDNYRRELERKHARRRTSVAGAASPR